MVSSDLRGTPTPTCVDICSDPLRVDPRHLLRAPSSAKVRSARRFSAPFRRAPLGSSRRAAPALRSRSRVDARTSADATAAARRGQGPRSVCPVGGHRHRDPAGTPGRRPIALEFSPPGIRSRVWSSASPRCSVSSPSLPAVGLLPHRSRLAPRSSRQLRPAVGDRPGRCGPQQRDDRRAHRRARRGRTTCPRVDQRCAHPRLGHVPDRRPASPRRDDRPRGVRPSGHRLPDRGRARLGRRGHRLDRRLPDPSGLHRGQRHRARLGDTLRDDATPVLRGFSWYAMGERDSRTGLRDHTGDRKTYVNAGSCARCPVLASSKPHSAALAVRGPSGDPEALRLDDPRCLAP